MYSGKYGVTIIIYVVVVTEKRHRANTIIL
jgi:hypothetical protein